MSNPSSSVLRNDPAFLEVYNLARLSAKHPDYPMPPGGRGPYAIWQEGTAPGDLTFTKTEFFLTREGKWLPVYAFLAMEVEERRKLCVFDTAAEAMKQIENLTGPAEVDVVRTAMAKGVGGGSAPMPPVTPES